MLAVVVYLSLYVCVCVGCSCLSSLYVCVCWL